MSPNIIKTDYYSDYDVNTFANIVNLQQKIIKSFIDVDLLDAAVFWFTNIVRKTYNLNQFQFHEKLRQSAILHSEQMIVHNFFGHENNFVKKYKTLSNRIDSVKDDEFQSFMCYGENIADYPIIKANQSFSFENKDGMTRLISTDGHEIFPYSHYEYAKIVVEGWMNSPGHRRNILNNDFLYLGCGCSKYKKQNNGYSMLYFKLTQNFGGTLISSNFSFGIENIINKFLK